MTSPAGMADAEVGVGGPPTHLLALPQRLIVLVWAIVAAANAVLSLLGPTAGSDLTAMLGTNLCGLGIALALSLVTQTVMERRLRPSWLLLTGLVLLGGTTVWVVDGTFQYWVQEHRRFHLPPWGQFLPVRYNWVYFNLIFALQTAALALLTSNRLLAARERQLVEARLAEQQARLAALRLQLNPHFLFNTLNAITTLVGEGRVRNAEEMISRLSDFLRATLLADPSDYITLDAELDTVKAYLEIEAVRFGDRLNARFICAPDLEEALVPSFILQPLVENAIKHAVAPAKGTVTVQIKAAKREGELVLVVEDDGRSASAVPKPAGTGVGLRNVSSRLRTLYGPLGRMEAIQRKQGFSVVLRLPLRRAGSAATG